MKHDFSALELQALAYHRYPHPGKIEVVPTKPYSTPEDMSLAYSPGVAAPSLEIAADPEEAYVYTGRGNTVGVISNGTAVLGLGNIGALAAKPVMEGKALLFKVFAGIDAFDIELSENDPARFIDAVKALSPTFGAINLEDIKAPECFEIEQGLSGKIDIPVMHDDQHGTAVVVGAAMINALMIQRKHIEDIRLVVNGAGAAAIACTRLLIALGIRRENIIMCDSRGVIRTDRTNLTPQKAEFAISADGPATLGEALAGADAFLGLSVADVFTPGMVASMAPRPIVFALANPDPEIARDKALAAATDIVYATGRSDYPNQINNVLGFPYIFRAALDCRARVINEEMKVAAAHAIASLARMPATDTVRKLYHDSHLEFGRDYILPKPFDRRLLTYVSPAVAKAAAESGTARRPIDDLERYGRELKLRISGADRRLRQFVDELRVQ